MHANINKWFQPTMSLIELSYVPLQEGYNYAWMKLGQDAGTVQMQIPRASFELPVGDATGQLRTIR